MTSHLPADNNPRHLPLWTGERSLPDTECLGDVLYDLSAGNPAGKLNSVIVAWLSKRAKLRTAMLLTCLKNLGG